jgi:predicted nucleic acid-binding protein
MNLYVESSAALAWLLEETAADDVEAAFGTAELVLASDLTLLECDRALIRSQALGALSDLEVSRRRSILEAAASRWTLLRIDGEVLERARRRFPQEPIRAIDSLHLASALTARSSVSDLALLSLDGRVRRNGAALGFDVLPA